MCNFQERRVVVKVIKITLTINDELCLLSIHTDMGKNGHKLISFSKEDHRQQSLLYYESGWNKIPFNIQVHVLSDGLTIPLC